MHSRTPMDSDSLRGYSFCHWNWIPNIQ